MPQVQRTRFTSWLKNLTGFRGPLALNLDAGISPVYNFADDHPELDDEVGLWMTTANLTASAANFTAIQAKVAAGLRAVVDGIIIRAQVAAQSYNIGITGEIAGAGTNTRVINNFLSARPLVFTSAAVGLGGVLNITQQVAASLFVAGTGAIVVGTLANGADLLLLNPGFPKHVITQGFAFTIESGVVNQPVAASIFGRFYGDQL